MSVNAKCWCRKSEDALTIWNIHLLNARQKLTRIMPELRTTIREAVALASERASLPDFDVVIRPEPGGGIPAWGVGGYAPTPGLIEITLDPARFEPPFLTRTLIHEMHHLIRWDGPGYGRSLGEALISEGLAGHFVLQVLGGKPDPWDSTPVAEGVAKQAMNEWARLDYDHARWFSGAGDLRKWTGYGLGHRLVGNFLTENPDQDAVTLAGVKAEEFRSVLRQMTRTKDEPSGPEEDVEKGEGDD